MAESKIRVANLALGKVGARSISSFGEDSPEARAISEVYDDILFEVLSEHIWSFAQKRAVLTTLAESPVFEDDGVTIVYGLPSDFLKLNFTNTQFAIVHLEDGKILSDTQDLKIKYTYKNEDPTKYTVKFTQALVARLAAEICFTLTNSVSKTEKLQKNYDDNILPSAVAADSTQGSPTEAHQNEWIDARRLGSRQFITTGETWHPV